MKVILIPASVDLVGVSTHVYNLARLLKDRGLLDSVVCPREGWLSQTLKEEGISCFIVDISFRPRRYVSSNFLLSRFLASRPSANVVHLHGRLPLFASVVSLLTCRHLAFVATVHQFAFTGLEPRYDWKRGLETLMLGRMKRICCVSEGLRIEVLNRTGKRPSEVEVIPNWVEPLWAGREVERLSLCQIRKRAKFTRICGIGRLSREKGFDILLKSVSILEKGGYSVKCDIFGDGPEKESLARLADELGITKNICLNKPSRDVRRLLPNYHALVIPSRTEAFPFVVLEAYDACMPVIASDVAGLRSTVLHAQTGLLFEAGSPQSLAAAMKKLIDSEALVNELGTNGRRYLEGYLPNEKLKLKYANFYAEAQLGDPDGHALDKKVAFE
jgi:glycosyltransferase involved in cell wall biosynthesis